jgi:peptidoglycan/xylan/chitin deacetylase (PgdA/CDA1 family)
MFVTWARVRRGIKRLQHHWRPRGLVLLYHRVAELSADPWSLAVTPAHFAEHLAVLRSKTIPFTLMELFSHRAERRHSPWPVAVTFDDGYADNLLNAIPELRRANIPATFFLTSGPAGRKVEFWWDDLERILLNPGTLPARLHLCLSEGPCEWNLEHAATYTDVDAQKYSGWRAWNDPPTPRHFLYRSLWELLHGLPEAARSEVLKQLYAWAGIGPDVRPTHRAMSEHEVRALAQEPLIDVGAHTVTHSVLAKLPRRQQEDEIMTCKTDLEHLTGKPVTTFAYPYGQRTDYNEETTRTVQEAGFSLACVNYPGLVTTVTDPYQLPRMYVQDWDSETFARNLSAWSEVSL